MNALFVYDFTLPECERNKVLSLLKVHCKKWCFQLEEGESGYRHYQGRFSLGTKRRMGDCIKLWHAHDLNEVHLSITSDTNKENAFYVMKPECRLEGPWSDTNEEIIIPKQIAGLTLYDWQQQIVDDAKVWDTRHINVIIEEVGNVGKSILNTYVGVHKIGTSIPPMNEYKDLMRTVMDRPTSKLYLVDIPRALDKKKQAGLFAALEEIKSGHAWDDRYKYQEKWFDCPNIWVFTNHMPDISLLSVDRWILWEIVDKKLIRKILFV